MIFISFIITVDLAAAVIIVCHHHSFMWELQRKPWISCGEREFSEGEIAEFLRNKDLDCGEGIFLSICLYA
uniref:Uncharacterized protein n=1 Tax=Manihot esculenta TaxID=3983 RepID=A0A2C9V301_MANES